MINLKCCFCGEIYQKSKTATLRYLCPSKNSKTNTCSSECKIALTRTKKEVSCSNCFKSFLILPKEIKKSKSGNNFCSRSCSTTWNNKNKPTGNRRSKLEIYLEEKLSNLYDFEIHYNRKDAINSELDIYIPHLKLAFEMNGIFHYEPIYSEEKLLKTQNNDKRKFQACLERNIELCIIDSSKLSYSIERNMKPFLDIVVGTIQEKLVANN